MPQSSIDPLRILIVEDDVETLRVMERLLAKRGHVVTIAEGQRAAVRAADGRELDLVISDLGLADGDGHDLIRQIESSRPNPIPAIALSGSGMDDDRRRSREAGFDEHLVKPIDFATLEAAIRRVMMSRADG